MARYFCFILFLTAQFAYGADLPDGFEPHCIAENKAAIERLQERLKNIKALAGMTYSLKKEDAESYKRLEGILRDDLAALVSRKKIIPPSLPSASLQKGAYGTLIPYLTPYTSAKVLQVTGEKSFIVQVVGGKGMESVSLWVDGLPTDDLVDGKSLDACTIVFIVRGTKSYTTALGAARTIYRIEPLDCKEALEGIRLKLAQQDAAEEAKAREAQAQKEAEAARAFAEEKERRRRLQEQQERKEAEAARKRINEYILKDGRTIKVVSRMSAGDGQLVLTDVDGKKYGILETDILEIKKP